MSASISASRAASAPIFQPAFPPRQSRLPTFQYSLFVSAQHFPIPPTHCAVGLGSRTRNRTTSLHRRRQAEGYYRTGPALSRFQSASGAVSRDTTASEVCSNRRIPRVRHSPSHPICIRIHIRPRTPTRCNSSHQCLPQAQPTKTVLRRPVPEHSCRPSLVTARSLPCLRRKSSVPRSRRSRSDSRRSTSSRTRPRMTRGGYTRKPPPFFPRARLLRLRTGRGIVCASRGCPRCLWVEANSKPDDSLDVVQQPQRARMCGFGDKVSLFSLVWSRDTKRQDGSRLDRIADPSHRRPV